MIEGQLYATGTSKCVPAQLVISGSDFQLHAEGHSVINGNCGTLKISDRIGHVARKITLQDGYVFETKDNDAVDRLLKPKTQSSSFMSLLHRLESHLTLVLISIVITIGIVFSSIRWGLPAASHAIAEALPNSVNQSLSYHALEYLDTTLFEPSRLSEAQQSAVRQDFENILVPLYNSHETQTFTLHFRRWSLNTEHGIANAFALPNGSIIVTDRLIELAQNDAEIQLVLLHEMGHIVEKHSLKQAIESSIIVVGSSLLFGDVSNLSDLGIGIGSLLINKAYSRNYETQADEFAYQLALKAHLPPSSLGKILLRMENDTKPVSSDDTDQDSKEKQSNWLDVLSTHPNSEQRAMMGERYEVCFQQGLLDCSPTD